MSSASAFRFCRSHIYPISLLPLFLSITLGYGLPTPIFLATLAILILPIRPSREARITDKPAVEETVEGESIQQESSQTEEQRSIMEEEEYEVTEGECERRLSWTTSEESEVEYWPFEGNMFQSPDCLEGGYISDEESLIEIALPGGEFVRRASPMSCKDGKFGIGRSYLKQMMIEEDNLIEIDISMGSIKCTSCSSRFEIEAC
ncbi:hypothetical protein LINPERPRIM_LOCUS43759 [Linum perenne]